jgi:hypothetical protein
MSKKSTIAATVIALGIMGTASVFAGERTTGRGTGPIVYVQSQGLFYDSIVLPNLPRKGPFQELLPGVGPTGLATEFGPGDVGYLGGRWWLDVNGDGEMDDDDDYFLCPLLGPGRESP